MIKLQKSTLRNWLFDLFSSPLYMVCVLAFSLFSVGLLIGLLWIVPVWWGYILYGSGIGFGLYLAYVTVCDLIDSGYLTLK